MFRSWWAEKQAQKLDDADEEESTQMFVSYLFRQSPSIEKPQQGSSMKEQPLAFSQQ